MSSDNRALLLDFRGFAGELSNSLKGCYATRRGARLCRANALAVLTAERLQEVIGGGNRC